MNPGSPGSARRSLKARALQCLAQREHSRSELRRKLLRHAQADPSGDETACTTPTCVDALLDWLEAHRYLSEERFVESRVHARESRFGNLRIRQELAQHQLTLSPTAEQGLKDSEFARARDVWSRRFAGGGTTPAERAKQARFLIGRGFSAEVVRRVLRDAGNTPADDTADTAQA